MVTQLYIVKNINVHPHAHHEPGERLKALYYMVHNVGVHGVNHNKDRRRETKESWR
jgi:hypothetical protein